MKWTYISLDELREINVPYLEGNWEREQLDAPLVYFETFLEVLILFEEGRIVDNNLGIRSQGTPRGRRRMTTVLAT